MSAIISSLIAPIALPLGSFLAIPMLSSWSTSLNLIFLSVAWTTIAASYSPLQLELFAPFVIRTSLYILPSLFFLIFDIGVPSLATEFKSQGQWGIPAKQNGGARKVRKVVAWSVFNVLMTVLLQAAIEFLVTDVLKMKSLLLVKGSKWSLNHLPNPWTMFKHAVVGIVSRNVRLIKMCAHFVRRLMSIAGHPVLHSHAPTPLAIWWCPVRLTSVMASQCQNPVLFRGELRLSRCTPPASLASSVSACNCFAHAHPYLSNPGRHFLTRRDVYILWLQRPAVHNYATRHGAPL